jgi:hypothetical protein
MPEIKVPETGGVVRRALDERRRLSNVARGAMEAWKVPRGRNGCIRPTPDIALSYVMRRVSALAFHSTSA